MCSKVDKEAGTATIEAYKNTKIWFCLNERGWFAATALNILHKYFLKVTDAIKVREIQKGHVYLCDEEKPVLFLSMKSYLNCFSSMNSRSENKPKDLL